MKELPTVPAPKPNNKTRSYVVLFLVICCALGVLLFRIGVVGGAKESEIPTPAAVVEELATSTPKIVENYVNAQVGDCFKFGRYPQGQNGEIEPIIWRVLKRNSDSLLVISEKALDAKPYNEEYVKVTWADCTLRRWLNKEFMNKAFSERERSLIKTVNISNNAGPSTKDRVFLLSVDEAQSLFTSYDDRKCESTDYAVKNGAYTYIGSAWWWLRSRGSNSYDAASVYDGFINYGVFRDGGSVRPAFRLAI